MGFSVFFKRIFFFNKVWIVTVADRNLKIVFLAVSGIPTLFNSLFDKKNVVLDGSSIPGVDLQTLLSISCFVK